jgi:hypothetical protein
MERRARRDAAYEQQARNEAERGRPGLARLPLVRAAATRLWQSPPRTVLLHGDFLAKNLLCNGTGICSRRTRRSPPRHQDQLRKVAEVRLDPLDLLVPYDLGGAAMEANLWPAATTGTGFYEKVQTDTIQRQMVCRGDVSLAAAQHALE